MSWLYTIVFAGLMLTSDASTPISANSNHTDSQITNTVQTDETERFEQTYSLNANGRVSISNVNGSIVVNTWDKNEVKLEYVKTADAKESLGEVEIKIDARQESFSVQSNYLDWKRPGASSRIYNKLTVEYRLTVPRNAVLNEIETVNGTVSITNAANLTKASAVNGEVRAVNLSGTANLSTVNGTVIADFDQMPAGGKISLNTVNGTVELTIPSDANATVKADTVNGKISNDFGLKVRKGEYVGSDLHGKIGSGEAQIRLNSVNGGLSVKRKNDGKNLNPAVNLLNVKSGDDDDWEDGENSSRVKPPKPPKAPKLPKPPELPVIADEIDGEAIRRSIEESMKDVNRELANIQPELEKQYAEAMKQAALLDSKEMRARIKDAVKYSAAWERMADGYWTIGSPSIEKKSGSFAVKGTPKVTVEAKDCAVTVRGWDKSEVSYSIVRTTRSNQKPLDTEWTTSATKNNDSDVIFKIISETKTEDGMVFDEATKIRLEIFVPKKTDLKIKTSGEIRLEGVSGEIDLQGDDEAINIRDGGGRLTVNSTDARIRVIGFKGEVAATNVDGTMNFEGDFKMLSAQTGDGEIVLTLPENVNANIESNGKDIVGEGFTPTYKDDGKGGFIWKIGSGGSVHRLSATEDGQVIVRNANALKSIQ